MSLTFNVGYFEGQRHSKMWIITDEDLTTMYEKYPSGEILLWCDGASDETEVTVNKRKRDAVQMASSKHQEREEEVDELFKELKDKHKDKYDLPKLRLWARMMASNLHDSIEEPPNVPAFGGDAGSKKRRISLSEAINGAAVAFSNICKNEKPPDSVVLTSAVELRMKNFEQLRYLQQLYDDNILSCTEYTEQKQKILDCLSKL